MEPIKRYDIGLGRIIEPFDNGTLCLSSDVAKLEAELVNVSAENTLVSQQNSALNDALKKLEAESANRLKRIDTLEAELVERKHEVSAKETALGIDKTALVNELAKQEGEKIELEAESAKLREIVLEVARCGVSWDAGKYVEVQIDAGTWADVRCVLAEGEPQ